MVNQDNERNYIRQYGTRWVSQYANDIVAGQKVDLRLNPDMPYHSFYGWFQAYTKASGAVSSVALTSLGTLELLRDNSPLMTMRWDQLIQSSATGNFSSYSPAWNTASGTSSLSGDTINFYLAGVLGRFNAPGLPLFAHADTLRFTLEFASITTFATTGLVLGMVMKSTPVRV